MISYELLDAIGGIDPKHVQAAEAMRPHSRKGLLTAIAAAAVLLLVSFAIWKGLFVTPEKPPETYADTSLDLTEATVAEKVISSQYRTQILDDAYADYHSVRVCDPAYVDLEHELAEILVEGGWKDGNGVAIDTPETLRAIVYPLREIPEDQAICLFFLDKGDALTTTHYYVYLKEGLGAEETELIYEKLNWNEPKPVPGTEKDGLVIGTTSSDPGEE